MKAFVPLPAIEREPVDLASLPSDMTLEDARQLLGFPTTDGRKVIGLTGKPGLGYTEGLYVTIASGDAKSEHKRVGDTTSSVSD